MGDKNAKCNDDAREGGKFFHSILVLIGCIF